MRRANGTGTVIKMKGNRRKKYRVRITKGWTIDEKTGKAKQIIKDLGCYMTQKEANDALQDYLGCPYDLTANRMSMKELYDVWFEEYSADLKGDSSRRTITNAFEYCTSIYNMNIRDVIPRIIEKEEFAFLEKGLKQRVVALNLFLKDIYSKKQIVKDGVVPEDFIFASSGYMVECEGVCPPKAIYSHISGIDLVKGKNDKWYILEDNLRVPSGASYPMIARELCRRSSPDTFVDLKIEDNRNYADLLRRTMDYVNVEGHTVILTPGRYNAAYFEHSYLAEKTGAHLANGSELTVKDDKLYFITAEGKLERVGAVYRRISDEYLDPMNFNPESLIGIPHIYDVFRKGNVALLNAPGNGVADDKGIYYFVPKMIRYYLDEEPILSNAPTYLPFYEEDMNYVLEHFDDLVLKDVAEAGGYGVVFGNTMTKEQKENFIALLKKEPRRFIAQEVIDFQDIDILDEGAQVPRKSDLRAFVLMADEPLVWKSGLTRFSRNPDSFIVNSSQGGGFKDTWVLSQ